MKNKISDSLTLHQKKILIVAITIISGLAILFLAYKYCFKSKKIVLHHHHQNNHETEIQEQKSSKSKVKKDPQSPIDCIDKVGKKNLDQPQVTRNHLTVSDVLPKVNLKSVLERLKKNCNYAAEQQNKEVDKKFVLNKGFIPKDFKLFIPKKGWKSRKIYETNQVFHGLKVGIASCQGMRGEMEDADIAGYQSFKVKDQEESFDIFGVFDGHAGNKASAYVKANLAQYLKNALEMHNREILTDDGIFAALKQCCQKLDADYNGTDGTTAAFVALIKGKIWVANVGDSRTILVKDGKAVQASEDAKPGIPRYKKTIENLGGYVVFTEGKSERVNGILAVARAIGDKGLMGKDGETCCVSPDPKISCYLLEDFKGGYLLLACDGLFDVSSTNEIGQAVTQMDNWGEQVGNMSKRLVFSAICNGSKDNVTVVVVKL